MPQPDIITCKPTSWFLLRAGLVLAMFSVFGVWFYIDGTTGYRKKNFEYYLHATFEKATRVFSKMDAEKTLSEFSWREFASKQTVDFPDNPKVLPPDLELPMPWPEILLDYNKVKTLHHNKLWREYSTVLQLDEKPVEKPFDQAKIDEQIRVFYICMGLSLITLFFLIRTSLRSMAADKEALKTPDGKQIPYSSMRVLDLRKWDTKGIAFIEYESSSGKKRARIDGLTYGGFKQEHGEPAEALMSQIRRNFSGDIVEYVLDDQRKPQDLNSQDSGQDV